MQINRGNASKSMATPSKSLNFSKRKRNAEEISKENALFAKRLAQPLYFISFSRVFLSDHPVFLRKVAFKAAQTRKDIENYLKLRKHMTKMTFFPALHKKWRYFSRFL